MNRILLLLLLAGVWVDAFATPAGIFRAETKAPMQVTYQAVYRALEEARFWVVFEADTGSNIAGFADRWGDDYNRNRLEGIRSMVVCNGWFANKVSNADPDLLALCPLRVGLTHKQGVTAVLFARPTAVAQGSPGLAVVEEVEGIIIDAIKKGVAQADD